MRRIRRWLFGTAIVLLAVGFVFRVPLLELAARGLIDEDVPEPADAIVVLSGSVPDRTLEAVELYRSGFAPRIILSRSPSSSVYRHIEDMGAHLPAPAELSRSVAEQLGVPPGAIVEIGGWSPSTFTEAEMILRYVEARGYDAILLVTSKMHTRRAAMIFRYLAKGRCRIISRPSRYDPFQPETWWYDRTFQRRVVFEYQKLVVFFLLDRWHLGRLGEGPG